MANISIRLSASAEENNPVSSLLLDIFVLFTLERVDRMFTRTLLEGLNSRSSGRPWMEMRKGKEITDIWLAQQLRLYGIRPTTIWLGDIQAKGYFQDDFLDVFRRYISRSDLDALSAELGKGKSQTGDNE